MSAYYNEIDPYCVQWLRNLIKANIIPSGDVDPRDIAQVHPLDTSDYTQVHLFAGLGGWAYALTLAQWPDDRPIWTGSCPCQPFSVAGKGQGTSDPRHLWPHFFRLLKPNRPAVIMGEQVSGTAGYDWFDGVAFDLESENYIVRAVDIPSASVNAPHKRNRLYWVAYPGESGPSVSKQEELSGKRGWKQGGTVAESGESIGRMEHTQGVRRIEGWAEHEGIEGGSSITGAGGTVNGMGVTDSDRREKGDTSIPDTRFGRSTESGSREHSFWDNYKIIGPDRKGDYRRVGLDWSTQSPIRLLVNGISRRVVVVCAGCGITREINGDDLDETLYCAKCKIVLPHKITQTIEPSRVSMLKAFGNAVNPELAAEVIRAWMDVAP